MSVLRKAASTALTGGAQALSAASRLLEATARTVQPERRGPAVRRRVASPPRDAHSTAEVIAAVDDQVPERGTVAEAEPTPLLDETPHVRTSESHVAELAEQPATQVIAAVPTLSTDELRLLIEHETAHRNRVTVLGAIEKALVGDGSSATPRARRREIVLPEAGVVPTSGTMRTP